MGIAMRIDEVRTGSIFHFLMMDQNAVFRFFILHCFENFKNS